MSTFAESLNLWEKVMEKEEIRIWKAMKLGVGSVFVRGDVMIPNVSVEIANQTMCQTEYRAFWYELTPLR